MEEYVKAGECVVLATISDERNPLFPDVPTAKEQGIDLSYGTSLYAALKKGTDPAIVEKFSSYLENLVKNDAEFEKAVREAQQLTPVWRSGPDTLQYLNDTVENLYDIGFATR
jgi:tripartite-type tricarboxylate transporter receptor subunit TctC